MESRRCWSSSFLLAELKLDWSIVPVYQTLSLLIEPTVPAKASPCCRPWVSVRWRSILSNEWKFSLSKRASFDSSCFWPIGKHWLPFSGWLSCWAFGSSCVSPWDAKASRRRNSRRKRNRLNQQIKLHPWLLRFESGWLLDYSLQLPPIRFSIRSKDMDPNESLLQVSLRQKLFALATFPREISK